jgi:uncharacterized protein with PQ loop repeat
MLFFGWLAGIIGSLHTIPLILNIYNVKSVKGLSLYSLLLKLLAQLCYIIHGFNIKDAALLWMTLCVFIQTIIIIIQYFIYIKNDVNNVRNLYSL